MESGLYIGEIRHRRFRPKKHCFTYPLFMPYLDIDQIPALMAESRFTSYERWNWASFRNADHFGETHLSLRERLTRDAVAKGFQLPAGRIFLLTHLRYLGYNFNPVSFFYCYDQSEKLEMIMAEVRNTFGETYNYWLSRANAGATSHANARHYTHAKHFHVSPFLGMDAEYDWTFASPAGKLIVQQSERDSGGPLVDATLRMQRRDWNAWEIRRALARFPWVTAKVMAAIYWEAVRLSVKGVHPVPHPGPGKYASANSKTFGATWSAK